MTRVWKQECCGALPYLEPLYLNTPGGRREVGEVRLCGRCDKPLSLPKRFKGGSVITDVAWSQMRESRKTPPFYWRMQNGKAVPENYSGPAPVKEVQREPEPVELDPREEEI